MQNPLYSNAPMYAPTYPGQQPMYYAAPGMQPTTMNVNAYNTTVRFQDNHAQNPLGLGGGTAMVTTSGNVEDVLVSRIFSSLADAHGKADQVFHNFTSTPKYYRNPLKQKELLEQLSSMQVLVEDLIVKLTVGHNSLMVRADFRGTLLSMVHSVTRAVEGLREQHAGGCCCCVSPKPFLGNPNIARVANKLIEKLKTFNFDNLSMDLNLQGAVRLGGTAGVDYMSTAKAVSETTLGQQVQVQLLENGRVGPNDPSLLLTQSHTAATIQTTPAMSPPPYPGFQVAVRV